MAKKGYCIRWGKKHGNRKRRCLKRSKRSFGGYSRLNRRTRRQRRRSKRY